MKEIRFKTNAPGDKEKEKKKKGGGGRKEKKKRKKKEEKEYRKDQPMIRKAVVSSIIRV